MALVGPYLPFCLLHGIVAFVFSGIPVTAIVDEDPSFYVSPVDSDSPACSLYPANSSSCDYWVTGPDVNDVLQKADLNTQYPATNYMIVDCEKKYISTAAPETTAPETTTPETTAPETTALETTPMQVSTTSKDENVCRIYPSDQVNCDQWMSLPDSTDDTIVDANAPGTYYIIVDCNVPDPVEGLEFGVEQDEFGNYLVVAPKGSGNGYLIFSLAMGSKVLIKATISNVTLDGTDVSFNQTSLNGRLSISGIDHHSVELTVFNGASSITRNINVHLEEEILGLSLVVEESAQFNRTTAFIATVTSGSNIIYTFCIEQANAVEPIRCHNTNATGSLNYTFVHAGEANVTVTADNGPSKSNKSASIHVIHIVNGYTMTASHPTASTTDDVELTLHAPDSSYFPMGQMYMILQRDGQNLKQPEFLEIQPSESIVVLNSKFTPPGNITVLTIIANVFSRQNVTVDFRIGDPINVEMSLDKNEISSGVPLDIVLSNAGGWGFNYVLDLGDDGRFESLPDAITQSFPESLNFNYTYIKAGSFEIRFDAYNAVYRQSLVDNILIQHPVPKFTIDSAPSITIPNGWATFELNPELKDSPIPTEASCTISFGDETEPVNRVDWETGFPASHNYKIFGRFTVTIFCSNVVSNQEASFVLQVGNRDADIQGLTIEMPQYSLIDSPIEIRVSSESGSNVIYDVSIGSVSESISDKGGVRTWTMTHTFTVAETVQVSITARNDVNAVSRSTSTSVVKPVSGFQLTARPPIANTEDEIRFFFRAPGSNGFPTGPLTVQLLSDGTSLYTSDMEVGSGGDFEINFSRWTAANYKVTAIITSPVSQEKLTATVIVEASIPFFTFTSKSIVTIPDGVVDVKISTRADEARPTDPVCSIHYEDGIDEVVVWSYDISLSHTYTQTDKFNITISCHNRVSERAISQIVDICELTADGFRFVYPRVVPMNSSSTGVLVRFKYNLCGLQSLPSDVQMSWVFEPNLPMELEYIMDWEAEHRFRNRNDYNVRVFIKTLDTNTETAVTLPVRIGVLIVGSLSSTGRAEEDVFSLNVSGAFGDIVYFLVDFGEGKNISANETNMKEDDVKTFTKIYSTAGKYIPRVIAWSKDFVEERVLGKTFVVQYSVKKFEIDVEQETWIPPLSTVFNVRLPQKIDFTAVSCVFDLGDGSPAKHVNYNHYVVRHYALRAIHKFPSYGPFDISVTCSNSVSSMVVSDKLKLRSGDANGPRQSWNLILGVNVLAILAYSAL